MNHRPEDLVTLFNTLFLKSRGTELVRGDDEPEYLPAGVAGDYARVIFAHGYFASALHEISHWCIAGEQRRRLTDYGYWYCPDGRSREQQQAFERVEVKPQALEWLFSVACGSRFHISVDNLDGGGAIDEAGFRQRVIQQACRYLDEGLPARAGQFLDALTAFYGTGPDHFRRWRERHACLATGPAGAAHSLTTVSEAYDAIS
ncbi:elongation factor P hydroxylase [Marinobacter zhanjiangensis]|uniref:Elongation factor P hydroxylase n=1 Tax=Marinobacter zhanjiangensis TaxID=578215 RepID=A0ABQ3B8J5_9GAMM|nr:elongation factor P hydroxylase [Marinobacter zhanjiangensis]GGY84772.1 elongation factor P hydroxylase [Marinobacter zhanjiangensis]